MHSRRPSPIGVTVHREIVHAALPSRSVGALVEWNVPTKDIPDEDAPFYYMFDSHRADNMQTLPWNPYAGKPMTIGEGIHWILNQKERETKKRPRR